LQFGLYSGLLVFSGLPEAAQNHALVDGLSPLDLLRAIELVECLTPLSMLLQGGVQGRLPDVLRTVAAHISQIGSDGR